VTKTPRRRGRLTKNPADPQASSAKRQDRRKIGAGRPSGQVVRIGPGLDTINPLDAGAPGTLLRQLTSEAARLRQELRSRRLSLLMALATPIRPPKPAGGSYEPPRRPRRNMALTPLACKRSPSTPPTCGNRLRARSEAHLQPSSAQFSEVRSRCDLPNSSQLILRDSRETSATMRLTHPCSSRS
jgi:hypothetical protein